MYQKNRLMLLMSYRKFIEDITEYDPQQKSRGFMDLLTIFLLNLLLIYQQFIGTNREKSYL